MQKYQCLNLHPCGMATYSTDSNLTLISSSVARRLSPHSQSVWPSDDRCHARGWPTPILGAPQHREGWELAGLATLMLLLSADLAVFYPGLLVFSFKTKESYNFFKCSNQEIWHILLPRICLPAFQDHPKGAELENCCRSPAKLRVFSPPPVYVLFMLYMHVPVCTPTHACGGQKRMLAVLLPHCPPC